jgi:methionyl-tRNA synthetase
VYAHAFWVRDGQKMSKSLGNFVDIDTLDGYATQHGPLNDARRPFRVEGLGGCRQTWACELISHPDPSSSDASHGGGACRYVAKYGLDGIRYFLLTQGPIGAVDANFSESRLHDVYTSELVNTLGAPHARHILLTDNV